MKFQKAIFVLTSVLAVALVSAQGNSAQGKSVVLKPPVNKPMTKAQWQKAYNDAAKMFDKMNADAIFQVMTPDFKLTMMGQTLNATQAKASLKQWFATMKNLHCSMTITKVDGDANHATITDNFNNWGMTKPDKKHKSGKLVDKGTEVAEWVQTKGVWRMKSLTSTNEKMTMDGKPFNPNMGGQ